MGLLDSGRSPHPTTLTSSPPHLLRATPIGTPCHENTARPRDAFAQRHVRKLQTGGDEGRAAGGPGRPSQHSGPAPHQEEERKQLTPGAAWHPPVYLSLHVAGRVWDAVQSS